MLGTIIFVGEAVKHICDEGGLSLLDPRDKLEAVWLNNSEFCEKYFLNENQFNADLDFLAEKYYPQGGY